MTNLLGKKIRTHNVVVLNKNKIMIFEKKYQKKSKKVYELLFFQKNKLVIYKFFSKYSL